MECHNCGRSVQRTDRFCNGCGTSLEGVTDTPKPVTTVDDRVGDGGDGRSGETTASHHGPHTEPIAAGASNADDDTTATDSLPRTELIAEPGDDLAEDEPSWARTGAVAATAAATTDLPATEPITEVWMDAVDAEPAPPTPYDFVEQEPAAATTQIGTPVAETAAMPAVVAEPVEERGRFSFTLVLFVSIVTALVALGGLFADVISITSDVRLVQTDDTPPEFRTGTWIVDDLADNLSIAGLIAIALMVAGGVASAFGWRWGSGLAGGSGLAVAGLAALVAGLAQFPIDLARAFARVPAEDPFVLTITRDLGYWLLIAAGALGIVLFFASINDATGDRRPGLNPWIAALGALAVVIAAAGPLLPENQAIFSDNWYLIEGPGEASSMLLVGRLVQVGLFAVGGVVGFLSVRRWGLGLAVGSTLPGVWLVVSTLFDLTNDPVGLGWQNRGAVDMHVHGVTIIGVSAVLAMLVLAVIAAYDQGVREGH